MKFLWYIHALAHAFSSPSLFPHVNNTKTGNVNLYPKDVAVSIAPCITAALHIMLKVYNWFYGRTHMLIKGCSSKYNTAWKYRTDSRYQKAFKTRTQHTSLWATNRTLQTSSPSTQIEGCSDPTLHMAESSPDFTTHLANLHLSSTWQMCMEVIKQF